MYGFGFQYGKISGGSVGETLAKAYQTRVEDDGGTYENGPCLVASLNRLNDINVYDDAGLVQIASSYKVSKLFSQKPTNGTGDLSFSRSTTATRVNENGVIETVAINTPRLDFTGGGCGKLLLEPQRTNLYINSGTLVTQNISTSATTYTVAFEGTGTITLSGTYSGSLVGTGASNRVSLTFTATSGTLTTSISGSCTSGQAEVGSYPTSYIPTAGSAVTRTADISPALTGISSLINSTEGVLYAKIAALGTINNAADVISIGDGTVFNQIAMWYSNATNQFKVLIRQSGNKLFSTVTLTDAQAFIKVAISYKSGVSRVYINGILVASSTSVFAFTAPLSVFHLGGSGLGDFNGKIKELAIINNALTPTELAELTTL